MTDRYELTEFKLGDDSTILVETITTNGGGETERLGLGGGKPEEAAKTFKETIGSIKGVAEAAINTIKEIADPPKEMTLELGLKLSGETGAIIAKASAEGNIKVVLKWVST